MAEIRRFLSSRTSDEDPAAGSLSKLEQWWPRTVTGVKELDAIPIAAKSSQPSVAAASASPMALLQSNNFS